MPRDSGESIFAARHQDVSQGPLGKPFLENLEFRGHHLHWILNCLQRTFSLLGLFSKLPSRGSRGSSKCWDLLCLEGSCSQSWERLGLLQDRKTQQPSKQPKNTSKILKNTIFGIFDVFLPYFACGSVFLFCRGPSFSQLKSSSRGSMVSWFEACKTNSPLPKQPPSSTPSSLIQGSTTARDINLHFRRTIFTRFVNSRYPKSLSTWFTMRFFFFFFSGRGGGKRGSPRRREGIGFLLKIPGGGEVLQDGRGRGAGRVSAAN